MTAAPAAETSTVIRRLPDPRTAVVTGAGGPAGIGRVTARLLAENGWHVALIDINADGLAGVEKELRDAGHSRLLALPTDIASESSVTETYERIDGELPQVVGLVNLAGIACPVPLARMQPGGIRAGDGGERHRLIPDAQSCSCANDPAGRRPNRQHVLDHRVRRGRHLLQGRLCRR